MTVWPRRPCWWCGRTVAHTWYVSRPARHHNTDGAVCYGVPNTPVSEAPPQGRPGDVHLPESEAVS